MNVRFHLIKDGRGTVGARKGTRFNFNGRILPSSSTSSVTSEGSAAADWNRTLCQVVEDRLAERIPRKNWNLSVQFNQDRWVGLTHYIRVEVQGGMLQQLNDIIMYGVKEGHISIQLMAMVEVTGPNNFKRRIPLGTNGIIPAAGDKLGMTYVRNIFFSLDDKPLDWKKVSRLKFSNLQVLVDGRISTGYGWFDGDPCSGSLEANQRLWELVEQGQGDVTIIGKDDVTIRCHGSVLQEQSPVFAAMLAGDHFVEGITREIRLKEWTEEEILAFLAYLYCRDMMWPCSLTVSVLALSHMYAFNLTNLLNFLRKMLLEKDGPFYYTPTSAEKLVKFGERTNDLHLRRKGLDMLKWFESNPAQMETD